MPWLQLHDVIKQIIKTIHCVINSSCILTTIVTGRTDF